MTAFTLEAALDDVRQANQGRDLARDELTRKVAVARSVGATWDLIAAALGVTRQSAHSMFAIDVANLADDG